MKKSSKRLRERSKFSSFFIFIRNILIIGVVFAAAGYYLANKYNKPDIEVREKIVEVFNNVGIPLEQKIRQLKDNLLNDLRHEEIKGHEKRSLVIVFDPLRKDLAKCRQVGGVRLYCYSTGDYNFKVATIQHYYKKFYDTSLNDKEAFMVAMDSEKSRELAEKIIFDEVGGIYNWRNSAKKINAVQRIKFIRELEA